MTNEQLYDYLFEHSNDLALLPPGYGGLCIIQGSYTYLSAWAIYRRTKRREHEIIRDARMINYRGDGNDQGGDSRFPAK